MAHKGAAMNTVRVDTETQKLLEKASAIMGFPVLTLLLSAWQ